MIAKTKINEHLSKTKCYKCKLSLEGAKVTPINKVSITLVTHVTCGNCLAENVVTISQVGEDTTPIASDLKSSEMQRFVDLKPTSYDELFELHEKLQRKPIWKLLQQSEKRLGKKQKSLERTDKSRP